MAAGAGYTKLEMEPDLVGGYQQAVGAMMAGAD
jgi:hypothetical protein